MDNQPFEGGLNEVNRQSSNRLKFNRQASKRAIFTINRQKEQLLLAVKRFNGLSNITISAAHPERLALKESF